MRLPPSFRNILEARRARDGELVLTSPDDEEEVEGNPPPAGEWWRWRGGSSGLHVCALPLPSLSERKNWEGGCWASASSPEEPLGLRGTRGDDDPAAEPLGASSEMSVV
jgi:hypothetical protein